MTNKLPNLSEMLKALSDPTRRKILQMLKQPSCCSIEKDEGMCACDIECQVNLSQPTISHHMKVLRDAGLVESEKVGQWVWYRRNEEAIRKLTEAFAKEI